MSDVVYTPEKIMEAIRAHHGLLAQAARQLGCSRKTIYRAMETHPEIAACVAECREVVLDMAEGRLIAICSDPESKHHFNGLHLLLRTVGRSRGYGDHSTVEAAVTVSVDPAAIASALDGILGTIPVPVLVTDEDDGDEDAE